MDNEKTIAAIRELVNQKPVDVETELRDVLIRNGFVKCDALMCGCGSWHARYGLPERMSEIEHALADAGHPLDNNNGHLPLRALMALIAERDSLRARPEAT